jgi:ribosome maturation factor RimP
MKVTQIEKAIGPAITARRCFLVGIDVTPDNDITVTIEREEGSVDMDDCVAINDAFAAIFDRDVEDYSLTVTSAGLDQPFRVLKQYLKAIGTIVVVLVKGGKKIKGELTAADNDSITVKHTEKEVVEGQKKKQSVEHTDTYKMSEINSVTPYLEFEK